MRSKINRRLMRSDAVRAHDGMGDASNNDDDGGFHHRLAHNLRNGYYSSDDEDDTSSCSSSAPSSGVQVMSDAQVVRVGDDWSDDEYQREPANMLI